MSLFDRLGGAPAIIAVAGLSTTKVLADPLLAPYFDEVGMDRQVAKQASFRARGRAPRAGDRGCRWLRQPGRGWGRV
jgi:hypothetical protein